MKKKESLHMPPVPRSSAIDQRRHVYQILSHRYGEEEYNSLNFKKRITSQPLA